MKIRVITPVGVFESNELTDISKENLQKYCKSIAKGEMTYVSFLNLNIEHYFSDNILKQSVIQLID